MISTFSLFQHFLRVLFEMGMIPQFFRKNVGERGSMIFHRKSFFFFYIFFPCFLQ